MKEKKYLFLFTDNSLYEMTCGISYKDAVWEMSKYTNTHNDTLLSALRGFKPNGVNGITEVYNGLTTEHKIRRCYIYTERFVFGVNWLWK